MPHYLAKNTLKASVVGIFLRLFYNYSDNPTLFKRHVETGNHGVSCFHHLRPIGLPLNPMKCGISLYASYGMESNRKADRRRDKLPSGEGGGCEEIKAIAM